MHKLMDDISKYHSDFRIAGNFCGCKICKNAIFADLLHLPLVLTQGTLIFCHAAELAKDKGPPRFAPQS